MIELLLSSCALAGLGIATYFSMVSYRIIEPDSKWIPPFCRMEPDSCMSILETREASIVGIRNSVLGMLDDGAILFVPIERFEIPFLVASIFSVGLGMYLVHALVYRLKIYCPLCYAAHGINLLIANLFIVRTMQNYSIL